MRISLEIDSVKDSAKEIKSKKRSWLKDKNMLQLYSLCAIPLLLIFVFNYLPMVGIIIAFKDYRFDLGIMGSDWVGLRNFMFFFQSNEFLHITWNTLSLNFLFIITGTVSAVILALILFEVKSRRATKTFQTMLITPNFLSWVIAGYMAYALLNPEYGFINRVIMYFGGAKIDWYSLPNVWPPILIVVSIWKCVGIDSVIYYAALMGIDSSYFEAAEIDGATKLQQIRYIVLPCILSLISIIIILKIGGIFRADFGLFYQLTRDVGALYPTTDVIDTYIFRTMRVIGNMGMSSAVGLLQSVVGFVLVIVTNYFSKKIDSENGLF